MRFDGHHFEVEQTDAAILWFARYLEKKGMDTDVASRADCAGMLLNVIPADDGWAYVLLGQRGYESAGVWVFKYSPTGPRDAGIAYSYGC